MVLFVRFLILITVLIGCFQITSIYLKIKEEFVPLFTFSTIGLVVFISGLLNIMIETVILIIVLSIVFLIKIIRAKKLNISSSLGKFFFLCLFFYFAILLRGKSLSHYDDFSHWGIIARELVQNNQFPNFSTELISFQSYPTGSASWIYFIAKILGSSEGVFLFAQNILISAAIIPIFSFIKENKISNTIVMVISTLFFLIANNTSFVLLVDTLVAILGLAISTIILYYFINDNLFKALITFLPIITFLITIKNSSMFFVIINFVLFTYFLFKRLGITKHTVSLSAASILLPSFISYLWTKHVEFSFPLGLESKHSLSLSNYEAMLESKSSTDIKEITHQFFNRVFNIGFKDTKIILFIFGIFISVIIYKKVLLKWPIKSIYEIKFITALFLVWLIYQVSLWGMYIVSMPLNEALILAGYERYIFTVIIYFYGILIIYLLYFSKKTNLGGKKYNINSILMLIIVLIPVLIRDRPQDILNLITLNQSKNEVREVLKEATTSRNLPKEESYYIYISDDTEMNASGLLNQVSRYELLTRDIKVLTQNSLDEKTIEQGMNEGRYLIILKMDDVLKNILDQFDLEDSSQSVIQLNDMYSE